jgi:hypothetical protein
LREPEVRIYTAARVRDSRAGCVALLVYPDRRQVVEQVVETRWNYIAWMNSVALGLETLALPATVEILAPEGFDTADVRRYIKGVPLGPVTPDLRERVARAAALHQIEVRGCGFGQRGSVLVNECLERARALVASRPQA